MTQSDSPSDAEPNKKNLKLLLRLKPVADVDTSVGRIYLYPLRTCDFGDFEKLEPENTVNQVRAFLSSIGSLTLESDEAPERTPLNPEVVKDISDEEIERLAEAYVQTPVFNRVSKGLQEQQIPLPREAGESASAYLLRLVKAEVDHHHQRAKHLQEKMFGSTRSLFDQVRKSSSALGSTLSAFEQLNKGTRTTPLEILPVHTDHLQAMNEQFARQARERKEELEMVRLTGKMTAESAKTLKDLADAATTLMEQMDERDQKSDKSTRKQITIAVWSVGISAFLALLALIVSGFAYLQDKKNNEFGDKWQAELIAVVRDGNKKLVAAEEETQRLRNKLAELEAKVSNFESARALALVAKRADSATRRETKPGRTLPPP